MMTEVLARTIINQCMFQPKRWRYFCNPVMLVDCEEFAIELQDDDVTLNAFGILLSKNRQAMW
jgi:hypothetical protein